MAEAPFETQRQRGWHIIQYIHYLANVAVLYCIVYSVRFSFSPLMFDQLCTEIRQSLQASGSGLLGCPAVLGPVAKADLDNQPCGNSLDPKHACSKDSVINP